MNIKLYRNMAGLKQDQLAALLGIDRSTVAKWETNKSNPRTDLLPKLAKTLNCTVDDLLAEQKQKNPLRIGEDEKV